MGTERRESTVKLLLYAAILAVVCLHVGQGAIVRLRLHLMGAELVLPRFEKESCGVLECVSEWVLTPQHRFLLLGHVMRTHTLVRDGSNDQVFPVSKVRGISADSWSGLRVYPVEGGVPYRLVAKKPSAVKLPYFIGILPRSTDHEGVLSVPDVSPTISTISGLLGFGVLAILVFAAFLAPTSGIGAAAKRDDLITICVCSVAAIFSAAISSGMIDSLLPDGEIRSRALRSLLLLSIALLPLKFAFRRLRASLLVSIGVSTALVFAFTNLNWHLFRAGTGYVVLYTVVVIFLTAWLYCSQQKLAAGMSAICLVDSFKMLGIISIGDSPPIYVLQPILVASFSLVVADLGAIRIISLAAKAYQRFTRDISLSQLGASLHFGGLEEDVDFSHRVKGALPLVAQLTGAGRVSILLNLPFARPITHSFSFSDGAIVTHDDGQIPGAVTLRAFVYGDEAWFERYAEFAERLGIPHSKHLENADYVCIAPIRVNQTSMGVLMLTCFDDGYIERLIKSSTIEEERETCRLVVDTFAAKFSSVVIRTMKSSTSLSSELLGRIRDSIPAATSTQEFLMRFCDQIHQVTGMRTLLHQWTGDLGIAVAQSGFVPAEWQVFVDAPLNLSPAVQTAFGSTVVAFREQKSSYIKDWIEIRSKLHSKTVDIFVRMDVCSFLAVPLRAGDSRFVVTMMSRRDSAPRDPGLMRIVESTEAIFDAAVTVFGQRASVLALGKLANRLIGDDDVRAQIIAAAKEEHLQTTIGTARTSFLLLFDLAGSSNLPADTEEKARSYGRFYDEVNIAAQTHLGGKVRKTIGDAVIVTWDGTNTQLEELDCVTEKLERVVLRADTVAREVGCQGVRAVLHHGDYFFGLIGTASFGQIDVIGKGIDEVCKMEGAMKTHVLNGKKIKIAVSVAAATRLPRVTAVDYRRCKYQLLIPAARESDLRGSDIHWACTELNSASDDLGGVFALEKAS